MNKAREANKFASYIFNNYLGNCHLYPVCDDDKVPFKILFTIFGKNVRFCFATGFYIEAHR